MLYNLTCSAIPFCPAVTIISPVVSLVPENFFIGNLFNTASTSQGVGFPLIIIGGMSPLLSLLYSSLMCSVKSYIAQRVYFPLQQSILFCFIYID